MMKPFFFVLSIALTIAALLAPGNVVQAQVLPAGVPPPVPSVQTLPSYVHCTTASPSICYLVPTVAQCTAYTKIIGCTDILPTMAACVSNTNTLGCSLVLPSAQTCATAPQTPGCNAVDKANTNAPSPISIDATRAVTPAAPKATPPPAGQYVLPGPPQTTGQTPAPH